MGGLGSTRWNSCDIKLTVEECLVLCVSQLLQDGLLGSKQQLSENLVWKHPVSGFCYGFCKIKTSAEDWITLFFQDQNQKGKLFSFDIETTKPYFGGKRWWLICPKCDKRFVKLYFNTFNNHFTCRICGNLTYESCQLSGTKQFNYKASITNQLIISGDSSKEAQRKVRKYYLLVGKRAEES